ncbi:MAG TPA: PAS domain-containing sensor histidine kinase, partial [Microcoleaceae bacterium UBA11344]|nr:PAS domain-containing sensor histidine kinase [Microcoleaceae cyanobacterium UBA11344]
MFYQDPNPESKITDLSSFPNNTAKNSGEQANYQQSPKSLAQNEADSHISEADSINLCELQQMELAMEQLEEDLKASESRFR